MEAKGFVPKLERLLLAVDHSPNGKFAARLAGLVAGQRGIPITLLALGEETEKVETARRKGKTAGEEAAKSASDETKKSQQKEDQPDKVDVVVRTLATPSSEAIAQEAERGYDLLFVGIETMRGRDGFHGDVDRIAAAFDEPLAIVIGADEHLKNPEKSRLEMLVPVNGTDVSRRAAEIAIEIARGVDEAEITALYVASRNAKQRRGARARRQEKAILDDVQDLAGLYGRKVETAMHTDVAPDSAVVASAKRNGHNLIVMGVSRRPGEQLFFGETAAGVCKDAPISVVFVAS